MKGKESSYHIRAYRNGDEEEIVRLFNEVNSGYSGFVPRTSDYWRWCCLDRPDVDKEGIIIVDYEEKMVGYTVAGKSGYIWELCFDHACDGKHVISLMLKKATDYLSAIGADSVTVNMPREDSASRETCKDQEFVEIPPEMMFLGLLDFQRFFELLSQDKKEKLATLNNSVLITLEDAPTWIDPNVLIEIRDGVIRIKNDAAPHEVLVRTNMVTLLSILFGRTRPLRALLSLRLKIRPTWKIPIALKLLSSLQLNDPWFFPMADFG